MTRPKILPVMSVVVLAGLLPAYAQAGFQFITPSNSTARDAMPAAKTDMPTVPVPLVESAPLPETMMNSADPVQDAQPAQAKAQDAALLQGPPPAPLSPVSRDTAALRVQDRSAPPPRPVLPTALPVPAAAVASVGETAVTTTTSVVTQPVNPEIAAAADSGAVVEGFGSQVPLVLALRQIVPPNYRYAFGETITPGMRISWTGGKPWKEVIADVARANGMNVDIVSNVVAFRRQNASTATGAIPGNTPINTVGDAPIAAAMPPVQAEPVIAEPAPGAPQNLLPETSANATEKKIEIYQETSETVMPPTASQPETVVAKTTEIVTSSETPAAAEPAFIAEPVLPTTALREPVFDNPVLPAPAMVSENSAAVSAVTPAMSDEIIFDQPVSALAAPVSPAIAEPRETLASISDKDIEDALPDALPMVSSDAPAYPPMEANTDVPLPSSEQLFGDASTNADKAPAAEMMDEKLPDIFDSSMNIDEPAAYPVINKKILTAEEENAAIQEFPEQKKKSSKLAAPALSASQSSPYFQELNEARNKDAAKPLDLFDTAAPAAPPVRTQPVKTAASAKTGAKPVEKSASPEPLDLLGKDDASIGDLPGETLNDKILSSAQLPAALPAPVDAEAAAQAMPDEPAAADIATIQEWQATKNETMRQTLTAWSERAGVSLVWSSEYDYPLQTDLRINAGYADAVRTLLAGFSKAQPRPLGRLFNNKQAGAQPVLIVETQHLTN